MLTLCSAFMHSCMHACYTCGRSSSEQRQLIPNAVGHTNQHTDHMYMQLVMGQSDGCDTPCIVAQINKSRMKGSVKLRGKHDSITTDQWES
jgi:hypothetical protein